MHIGHLGFPHCHNDFSHKLWEFPKLPKLFRIFFGRYGNSPWFPKAAKVPQGKGNREKRSEADDVIKFAIESEEYYSIMNMLHNRLLKNFEWMEVLGTYGNLWEGFQEPQSFS